MVLFLSVFLLWLLSEQGKNPPELCTSLSVTFFIDCFGEFLVSSTISQHSHIKVQSLQQLSLYNSSYFYSYLWMHRLMQMQELWKAWLVSRANSTTWEGLLPLACCKIPSLLRPAAMERLSQTTLTFGEKRTSELSAASRIFPHHAEPFTRRYFLSLTSQWPQKDSSCE